MDIFDDEAVGNMPVMSVSELSGAVKRTVEGAFSRVRVRGELGRVSRPRSGHVYLDVKDDRSVLAGVIWKGVASRLNVAPEEGLEVVATGRLTTFPGQSRYQIVIDELELAGQGALMALLEKRKAAFAAEGLFAPERKQPIPYLPRVIGVVTSPSGAVIRDILHRLRDRFPREVLVWGVPVQGKGAEAQIAAAIAGFNRIDGQGALPRPDVLIVARGGGSVEDLWCFNEEAVVRAVAASDIPVISAVGHETDTTLIDYVADLRAPTPTAAAEQAVPVRRELMATISQLEARRARGLTIKMTRAQDRLRDLTRALPKPERLLDGPRQALDIQSERLSQALRHGVQRRKLRLSEASGSLRPGLLRRQIDGAHRQFEQLSGRLSPALQRCVGRKSERLSVQTAQLSPARLARIIGEQSRRVQEVGYRLAPIYQRNLLKRREQLAALDRLRETLGHHATLARGFAIVRDPAGHVVSAQAQAAALQEMRLTFADGDLRAKPVSPGEGEPSAKSTPKRLKPAAKTPPEQGSLF